jgi:hypothetical protein
MERDNTISNMTTMNSQGHVTRVSRFREVLPQVSAAIYWMNDPTFLKVFFFSGIMQLFLTCSCNF